MRVFSDNKMTSRRCAPACVIEVEGVGTWIGATTPTPTYPNSLNHNPKKGTCKVSSQKFSSPPKTNVAITTTLDNPVFLPYVSLMDRLPLNHTKWSDRLAFDVALLLEGSGERMAEVMDRHKIDANDLLIYNADKVFLKKVEHYRDEIREKGLTFKLKARAQAEELLTTSWLLIHDPSTSPAVKADLIKSTVKWAGLEPKTDAVVESGGGGVRITINLGNSPNDARTIEAPITEVTDVDSIEHSESV